MFVRALRMPYTILMALIIVFCVTGAYAQSNKLWDVGQMLVFGVVGYLMRKLGYSPAAMVLALVLGPLAERALRQRLIISDAGVLIFFTRPIAAVLVVAALAAVAVTAARATHAAMRTRVAPAAQDDYGRRRRPAAPRPGAPRAVRRVADRAPAAARSAVGATVRCAA